MTLQRTVRHASLNLDSMALSGDVTRVEQELVQPHESGHVRGKAKRRQLILSAAVEIMSEKGDGALTIRRIASRAGLSPVTVYNLFGSKYAVLKAIFEEDLASLTDYVESRASGDALIKIFDLIDLSTEYYRSREPFYKVLFTTLIRNSESELAIGNWSSRSMSIRKLLAAAVAQRKLRKDTPVDVLATIFIRLGKSITQEWVDGSLTAMQSRHELGISFHTVLAKFATGGTAEIMARLEERYGLRG